MKQVVLNTDDIIDSLSEDLVNDLVWESTLAQAQLSDTDPGSVEFLELYNNASNNVKYGEQYNHQTAFYALTLVQSLLESGRIGLLSDEENPDGEKESISHITKIAYRLFKYIVTICNTAEPSLMFTDEDYESFKSEETIDFVFPLKQQGLRTGDDINDDTTTGSI